MGALLFIAVFLASFLVGSGTSFFIQNQNSSLVNGPLPTPNPSEFCLPERKIIEERHQLIANSNFLIIDTFPTADGNFYPPDKSEEQASGLVEGMVKTENWGKILRWLFGGEPRPDGTDAHPDIDRRGKTWTLIKRNAPIPAWKIADTSGHMRWQIPNCFWQDVPCETVDSIPVYPTPFLNQPVKATLFHETTWIGYLDLDKISDNYLKNRYSQLKAEAEDEEKRAAIGDVWIATGWCGVAGDLGVDNKGISYESQEACDDPLIRDVLLVVTQKGLGARQGRSGKDVLPWGFNDIDDPNAFSSEEDWWFFDVYYNFDNKPVSYDSLPEWMKSCGQAPNDPYSPNNRINRSRGDKIRDFFNKLLVKVKLFKNFLVQKNAVEAAGYPQFISGRAIDFSSVDPSVGSAKIDSIKEKTYIVLSDIRRSETWKRLGTIEISDSQVGNLYIADSDKFIYLELGGLYYKYGVTYSEGERQETLKLGTFDPPKIFRPFTYEWYTPACKPAIYLYPEKETQLSVYLKPQGRLTETIPFYQNGWQNILVNSQGEIYFNQQKYPYLYYEAEIEQVVPPKEGWVVQQNKLKDFFEGILPLVGLNQQEAQDFKDYWLKKLKDKPYYFVSLLDQEYLDQIEKVEFSQKPDQFIRVRFFFAGLDEPIEVEPKLITRPPVRKGFVAVDWGGLIANGNCGEDSLKQQKVE